jgi:CheY-like chemotaxis protein
MIVDGGESERSRLLHPPTAASMAHDGLAAMPQPHVVLVAEDSPLCARMLEKTINRAGYVSEWAINGEVAVQKLRDNPGLYSIVLMDLRMPVLDGIGATKAIRSLLKLDIPIVAVTSETGFAVKQECLSSGFDDFCCKPLDLKKLVEVCERYILVRPPPTTTTLPAAAAAAAN